MLYVVGLGLGDEKDITVNGLEAVKRCERVYLEAYTSVLGVPKERLEALYGREVVVADREFVEQGIDGMLNEALKMDVAFLVVGDAFAATTHSDLVLRAKGLGCKVKHIYNASIMNAVAGCGLQLYRFGQAVSICFFTRTWRPDSFYDRIKENADLGLHTLLLLDIRVKEPSVEALCRGKKEYEPPRFMSCATCARQMLEVEDARGEKVYGPDSMCVAVARMGQDDELIKSCTLKEMCNIDMGGPLHSMVLVGETHPLENDMLAMHRAKDSDFLPEDQVPSQYLDDM
mmetsp:Transcript_9682/g.42244  ORF Transcript_9682/g.42244 Transcript_9682/m.42244 type:complete len:287 (-) Transcript_9682:26-886(-)